MPVLSDAIITLVESEALDANGISVDRAVVAVATATALALTPPALRTAERTPVSHAIAATRGMPVSSGAKALHSTSASALAKIPVSMWATADDAMPMAAVSGMPVLNDAMTVLDVSVETAARFMPVNRVEATVDSDTTEEPKRIPVNSAGGGIAAKHATTDWKTMLVVRGAPVTSLTIMAAALKGLGTLRATVVADTHETEEPKLIPVARLVIDPVVEAIAPVTRMPVAKSAPVLEAAIIEATS